MGRPPSPLTSAQVAPSLAYIRRALEREADVFSKPPRLVMAAYAALLSKSETLKPTDVLELVNAWVDAHLSREGRAAMRTAMRRQKADAAGATRRSKALRVPERTYADIDRLAGKLGLPLTKTLECLTQVALVDKDVQAMVRKLALAMSMTP